MKPKADPRKERWATVLYTPTLLVSLVVAGFYFKTLWGWYVAPLGVVEISHAHAVGLMILIGISKASRADFEHMMSSTHWEDLRWIFSMTVGMSILTAMGWGVHAWWM